jgi:ABC-type multidrug transport system fused ATPase/permease subunit
MQVPSFLRGLWSSFLRCRSYLFLVAGLRARGALCSLAFCRAAQLDWGNISSRSSSNGGDTVKRSEISCSDATSAPIGRVSELIGKCSGDVIAFYDAAVCLWILPLEIFAAIGILLFFVGWSGLGALAVLMLSITVSHFAGQSVERISAQKGEALASFSTALNEVIVGIMTIRLSGWTKVFHGRLVGCSTLVEDLSDKIAMRVWAASGMHNTSVDVMSLAILLFYVFVAKNDLTPASYTAYWILLSVLHGKVLEAPDLLLRHQLGRNAIRTFSVFISQATQWQPDALAFAATGVDNKKCSGDSSACTVHELWSYSAVVKGQRRKMEAAVESNASKKVVLDSSSFDCEIEVHAGEIRWSPPGAAANAKGPGITCSNIIIPAGGLTCIQGDVGTGKSTFLHGLLGETPILTSKMVFKRNMNTSDRTANMQPVPRPACAFVPQQPWLMNKSIRDNIIFDSPFPFDIQRYNHACAACSLVEDFAALPDGDLTYAGDRGENLSGGQRQRVSMARAAYSKSPIVLLDDALSALDPEVAAHTFDACILKMMSGRTRVLVTHSALVSNCADQVLALNGKVLTPVEMSENLTERYSSLGSCDERQTIRPKIRVPASSLAASNLNGNSIAAATSTAQPSKILSKCSNVKSIAAIKKRSRNGLMTFIHDFNDGIGGGFWIPFFNVVLFGAECGTVQTGAFMIAVYAEMSENGDEPDTIFYLGVYSLTIVLEVCSSSIDSIFDCAIISAPFFYLDHFFICARRPSALRKPANP